MAKKYWVGNKPDRSVNTVDESGTAAGVDIGVMVKLSKTLAFGDFTDGGGTSGTFTFGESIPAGAVFLRAVATTVTGFAGDTSATITIGDGTDVDRYNTGTPNVFATAAAGVDLGVPSGIVNHSTAKAPVVTITSAANWGDVDAGSITLELYYII